MIQVRIDQLKRERYREEKPTQQVEVYTIL